MNTAFRKSIILALLIGPFLFQACQQPDGNTTGSEYMPDMGHSIAYEANYYDYYYYNTWGSEEDYHKMSQPRKPVNGTIPRGFAGVHYAKGAKAQKAVMDHLDGNSSRQGIKVPVNGSVPYYYADTEAERTRASNELINSPFPITADGLARGEELYDIFCGICHGEKGDGNGYLVAEDNLNAAYPAAPANFLLDTFYNSTNGRFYHAIIYGKNVMGGYADKLSYEERWQVIHWIHALQAKEKKLAYDEKKNTLNTVDVPAAIWKTLAVNQVPEMEEEEVEAIKIEHQDGHDHGGHDHGSGH